MINLKVGILTVFFLLFLQGCSHTEYSELFTEQAIVDDVIYMPRIHDTDVGISMRGDLVISDIDIEAKYAIVFRCQHGKFVVEGSGLKYKTMWDSFKKGQEVWVIYREVYSVDGDNKYLSGYDFISAT